MIHIDFFGGTHGNFLAYSINALDDNLKSHNIFTKYGTSHNQYSKIIADAKHYSFNNTEIEKNAPKITIMANVTSYDCLLVNLLSFTRAGDFNFDLKNFGQNLYSQIHKTTFYQGIKNSLLHYGIDIDTNESIPVGTLRESFKYNFANPADNSMMKIVQDQKYINDSFIFYFRDFYDFKKYIKALQKIIEYFQLPYKIDVEWYAELWKKFILAIGALQMEKDVIEIYRAVIEKRNIPIDLNIIQEAWLNAELEKIYNKEFPFNMEKYFSDTDKIIKFIKGTK